MNVQAVYDASSFFRNPSHHASLAEGSIKQTVIFKQNKMWGFHGGKNHVLVFQAMISYSMVRENQISDVILSTALKCVFLKKSHLWVQPDETFFTSSQVT